MEHLTINIGRKTRTETLHGVPYIVAPMAMLAEGVLAGSNGPLYYPDEEVRKFPAVWNMKPIVVYHPSEGGSPVSATESHIAESRQVGMIMNSRYANGKLRAEAWLNPALLEKVDGRILKAIQQNHLVEVSTGVFTENEEKPGTFRNKPYTHIARNLRPDHLAILPDQVGAYSVKDGGGLMQHNSSTQDNLETVVSRAVEAALKKSGFIQNFRTEGLMDKKKFVDGLIANTATKWEASDSEFLLSMDETQLEKLAPVANKEATVVAPDPATGTPGATGVKATPLADALTAPAPTANTFEDFMRTAPPQFRGMVEQGLAQYTANRAAIVADIKANPNNTLTDNMLNSMDPATLQAVHAVAKAAPAPAPVANNYNFGAVPQPLFYGAAGGAGPTTNQNKDTPLVPVGIMG